MSHLLGPSSGPLATSDMLQSPLCGSLSSKPQANRACNTHLGAIRTCSCPDLTLHLIDVIA